MWFNTGHWWRTVNSLPLTVVLPITAGLVIWYKSWCLALALLVAPFLYPVNTVVMLCGYKGSGKDTFYNDLVKGRANWVLYGSKHKNRLATVQSLGRGFQRVAFADAVREDVNRDLREKVKLTDLDIIRCSTNKEADISPNIAISYRDLLKIHAASKRRIHPDWWASIGANKIKANNTIITDWRYMNEYDYISKTYPVITIRVFRKEVDVPSTLDTTEHELDQVETDYIALPAQDYDVQLQEARKLGFRTKLWP